MGCTESRESQQCKPTQFAVRPALSAESQPLDISQSVQFRVFKSYQDHYKLVSLLSLGNFSKVFKARHLQSNQLRAVKIVEMSQFRASDTKRVGKQMGVLRSIDHAHIIKGHESFYHRGRYYAVLELCEGGQLVKRMLMEELTPTNSWLCDIRRQLLSAVGYCHKQKIIHRNIRPQSVLLAAEEGWNIKLAGFVYALRRPQLLCDDDPIRIESAPPESCFIAPECKGLGYSEKSDIWSCGMLLYLLMTGSIHRTDNKENSAAPPKRTKLKRPTREFNYSELESITNDSARELLKWMLHASYTKRPSAEQCLEHPFLSKPPPNLAISKENITTVVNRLRNFHVQNVLENFIMMYNCHHLSTLKEKDEYIKEFEIIDVNSDGFVTKDELMNALVRFGVNPAEAKEQTDRLFETIDLNCNGVIDYSEYVMATLLSDRRVSDIDLDAMFRLINTNNKAALDLNDVFKVLDKRQTERFMKELGKLDETHELKVVNLEQFKTIMRAMLKSKGRLMNVDDSTMCE